MIDNNKNNSPRSTAGTSWAKPDIASFAALIVQRLGPQRWVTAADPENFSAWGCIEEAKDLLRATGYRGRVVIDLDESDEDA